MAVRVFTLWFPLSSLASIVLHIKDTYMISLDVTTIDELHKNILSVDVYRNCES